MGVRILPRAMTCFCCTTKSLTGNSVGDNFAVADARQRVRKDSGESPSLKEAGVSGPLGTELLVLAIFVFDHL